VKCGVSVGRISPPPEITWHLHCTQVPPPPQADGRNILLSPRVESKVPPEPTSISCSPFIRILTGPEGVSTDFAPSRMETNNRIITKNTTTLVNTIKVVAANAMMFECKKVYVL